MHRYKYNKRAGALQEAMGSHTADDHSYVAAHQTSPGLLPAVRNNLALTRQRQIEETGSDDTGLDPHKHVGQASFFFYTVEEGQKVLMVERDGTMEVVEGPRRIWLGKRRFRPMAHYVAHPGEFLVIRYRDGRQEHLSGPAHCWFDPRVHKSVAKEEVLQIDNKEAVVVYSDLDGKVTRRIAHGPAIFVPEPGEWLHTFSWHGSVGGAKVSNALVFQKLWLMPDQMYHDVMGVRTSDDAVLTVKLMIFFELVDIEQMMAASHDPVGDFVNAATSDVVEFLGRHDFESFKRHSEKLNDLSTYKQLLARANAIGYRIGKVVYRGYGAPPALQQMHDEAIQSRTRLQLERATQQQAQELEDFKQDRALARAGKDRHAHAEAFEQQLAIEGRQEAARLEQEAARRAAVRELALHDSQQTEALAAEQDARVRTHLAALAEMGVDLTAYLTQNRADKVIELRGQGSDPHLHVSS